jgi:sRNA-binding protein
MPAAQPPQVIHEKTVIVKSNEAEKRKADEARKQADQAKRRADDARRKAESQTSKRDEDTSSTPRAPSDKGREPVVAKDVFQNTGLAREIHYDSARWKATRTVTVDPERKLTEVGSADEGMSLMVSENATEPYKTILIAVPDEDGKYVEYRRQ